MTDEEIIKAYRKKKSMDDGGSEEDTNSTSTSSPNYTNAGVAGAKTMAGGGSGMDVASSAAMASGNPYLIAAGAGLAVLSGNEKRKREAAQAKIDAEMDRRNKVMTAMAGLGTGVGSIG